MTIQLDELFEEQNALAECSPEQLIADAQRLVEVAVEKYRDETAISRLQRFHSSQPALDWNTFSSGTPEITHEADPTGFGESQVVTAAHFPRLITAVEELQRKATALQTIFAGFADQAFARESERMDLLNMPAGKAPYRNSAEYLRDILKISLVDAKSRIRLANDCMVTISPDSARRNEPQFPVLSEKFFNGEVPARIASHIFEAVDKVKRAASEYRIPPESSRPVIDEGAAALIKQSDALDTDNFRQLAHRWRTRLEYTFNQDGTPPTDEVVNRRHGAFYRGEKNGHHEWVLRGGALFHEKLRALASVFTSHVIDLTALPAVTDNPKVPVDIEEPALSSEQEEQVPEDMAAQAQQEPLFADPRTSVDQHGQRVATADMRTREQKVLDGLSAVLDAGVRAARDARSSPTGLAAQVGVLIDYETLLADVTASSTTDSHTDNYVSQALFSGPITPTTIRAIACEANVLPTVLGSTGAVLDQGRAQRLFTAEQRAAVIARDRGCAAPGCTMPAVWCEIHHIVPWSEGGETTVSNAVLLCSHHHHAVHAGLWSIEVLDGLPWFRSAVFLDPDQRLRRNYYWR